MPEFFPFQLLLATFAGWVNRHQAQAIDYPVEENRVLKEQLGGRRLRLTDDQRRRLAAKGKPLDCRLSRLLFAEDTKPRDLADSKTGSKARRPQDWTPEAAGRGGGVWADTNRTLWTAVPLQRT